MGNNKKRIVYLGMGGVYSLVPLKGLLSSGAQVAAIVFPRLIRDEEGPRWMPALTELSSDPDLVVNPVRENILTVAGIYSVPVLEVGSMRHAETLQAIEKLAPDLVVVACFPQILPEEFLRIPKLGCLNIHPSLLPAYRGPQPLFWQFQAGEQDMGVTVHWMDAGPDSGDILGQANLIYLEGLGSVELDRLAAQAGADIVLHALSHDDWPRQPQTDLGASYQAAPKDEDKLIKSSWHVRRVYNFLRAADVCAPFWVEMPNGEKIEVNQALGYEIGKNLNSPVEQRDGETWLQMQAGALWVR